MRYIPKIIIPVFLLLCFYIGFRLYGFLRRIFPRIRKTWFWVVYSAFPVSFLVSSYLPVSAFAKVLANIGYIYLSFFIFALFLLVLAEIVRLVLYLIRKLPPKGEKRKVLHIVSGSVICTILIATVAGGMINAYSVTTTKYDIDIKKQCSLSNLKVAMVSDIHLGYQIGNGQLEKAVEKINAQNPDIVFIVGDIFDSTTDMLFDLTKAENIFLGIKSKYGVFACLGNHDVYSGDLEAFLSESKITLLKDESVLIGNSFYVVGRNDRDLLTGDRNRRTKLSDIMKDTDKTKPVILLDHRPQAFEEAKENGADIVLSGHSHEGQFFPINLITDKIYTTDYGYGVYGDTQAIVSSGVGLWGPPIRIGTRAEVVAINVGFSK